MRIGIFGDIHSNLEALDAVLDYFIKEKVKDLVCLGDIVGYGADPIPCIDRVRELGCPVIAGNHDFAVVDKINVDFFNSYAREAALWTRKVLKPEHKSFLANLPLVKKFDGCTAVHSTLHAPELFEYIQTSYDAELSFENLDTAVCFVGHSHVPVAFFQRKAVSFSLDPVIKIERRAKTIVNVGSVGQPRDENPDACFAIYDSQQDVVQICRVAYDIDKAAHKIVKAGLPEILAERLRYGR